MSKHADRLREQQKDLEPGNERPNVAPRPVDEANRCNGGRPGGEHQFSQVVRGPDGFEDDRSDRVVRCCFCGELSPFSKERIAAWRARTA